MITAFPREKLAVMNFLSQVEFDYPAAISFASGRPSDRFFEVDRWLQSIQVFQEYDAVRNGYDAAAALRRVAQYGRTNGIINELVAQHLALDSNLSSEPEHIIVTNGCQEAISLIVQELCGADDVVLARDPTYTGITGAVLGANVSIAAIGAGDLASALRRTISDVRAGGKTPRLLYLIPDFDNPSGTVISPADREAILKIAGEERLLILEDGTYSMFRFNGSHVKSLAELDKSGAVIYLHTFSKTLCPSVRVGVAVIPKELFGDAKSSQQLINALSERKSYLAVNTSQINQAMVAGILLSEQCSLERLVSRARTFYRRNRDVLTEELRLAMGTHADSIQWNRPEGGFFLVVDLPFTFGSEEMLTCANEYSVIAMPMSFFSLTDGHQRTVRLAYSNLDPDRIATGAHRFSRFVLDRIGAQ